MIHGIKRHAIAVDTPEDVAQDLAETFLIAFRGS
jgi:hypothetical protein